MHKITQAELSAIDAIMSAYMSCNAAPGPLEWEVSTGRCIPPTAMGFLALAGRTAWEQIGQPAEMWDEMVMCGESAAYVLNLFT